MHSGAWRPMRMPTRTLAFLEIAYLYEILAGCFRACYLKKRPRCISFLSRLEH